jgi:DNA-binding MarR family transcriptional regulator
MAIEYMSAVFNLDLSPTNKLVLLTLANYSDIEGNCFPGQKRLIKMTNLGERALRTSLRSLEKENYIITTTRYRENGSRTTNHYQLTEKVLTAPASAAGTPGTTCPTPRQQMPVPPAADAGHISVTNNHQDNINTLNARARDDKKLSQTRRAQMSEEFIALYPLKKSVGDAEKWYMNQRDMTEELHTRILDAVKAQKIEFEYLSSHKPQFIPYPASWLNSKGWRNEVKTEAEIRAMEGTNNKQGTTYANKQTNIINADGSIQRPRKETPDQRFLRELKENREREGTEWMDDIQRKADELIARKYQNRPVGFNKLAADISQRIGNEGSI